MNTFKIFISCLSLFLFSNLHIQAQSTPEGRLIALQKQIQECKDDIELVESMLSSIEGINNSLTVPARKAWTERLNARRECLEKAEKELEFLKAWYPSLFMPKSVMVDNDKGKDKGKGEHSDALKRLAQNVQELFDSANDALKGLTKQIQNLLGE